MTQIWANAVVVFLTGASAALALWAVLRARDVTALHNGLVAALRDHNVLRMSMAEEAGMRGAGHPNAEVTGPQRVPDTTPPPTLPDGTLVWDWLRHNTHNPGQAVAGVTTKLYIRACNDELPGPYLRDIDREALESKFSAMAIMLLKHGVTARLALAMTRAHAGVLAPDGTPITGKVFDRTIALFGEALAEAGIPKVAIDAIAATVDPPSPLPSLRAAIVVETEPVR
jgi:hypothetical protein